MKSIFEAVPKLEEWQVGDKVAMDIIPLEIKVGLTHAKVIQGVITAISPEGIVTIKWDEDSFNDGYFHELKFDNISKTRSQFLNLSWLARIANDYTPKKKRRKEQK